MTKLSDIAYSGTLTSLTATSLTTLPPNVGAWVIGGNFYIQQHRKPRWLTRFLMRVLVEWEWRDSK